MNSENIPNKSELPSTERLIKSTIIALAVAMVVLVTVVMPAEYGVDPTGVGSVLGLTRMGEIKNSLAEDVKAEAIKAETTKAEVTSQPKPVAVVVEPVTSEVVASGSKVATLSHEKTVTLANDESIEIKLVMVKGGVVKYNWKSSGGKVSYDVHGDSKELGINYHSYKKGVSGAMSGTMTAAFNGNHGWWWRNRTGETLNITLKTDGQYSDIYEQK